MIILAGGAEEQHVVAAGILVGPWVGAADTVIDPTDKYTGAASFIFKGGAGGTGTTVTSRSKGWWSYAAFLPAYGNGTHRAMWDLGFNTGETAIKLGWAKGASNDEHQIRLVTQTGTYDSTSEYTKEQWHRIKVEFDGGVWTIWASDNGAAWTTALSQDDSGTYTTLNNMRMSVNITSDEGKAANSWYRADDCLFWDTSGDNWNTRIGADDFPRISAAHMPDVTGAKTESDAGQAVKLDEIPPDDVDNATIDETDYWTDVEDFKFADSGTADAAVSTTAGSPGTLTDTRVSWKINEWAGHTVTCNGETMTVASNTGNVLTGGDWSGDPGDGNAWEISVLTIQAVMVTRVDEAVESGGELYKFNLREGGTLYADSEEGGRQIQLGTGGDDWFTVAGYYPWTPGNVSWTEAIFEACQYGCSIVTDETDQITAQIIYFGSSAEWEPPAVTHVRQGVALGSTNVMSY